MSLKRLMACLLKTPKAYQGAELSSHVRQGGSHHGVQLSKLVLSRGICTTLIFLLLPGDTVHRTFYPVFKTLQARIAKLLSTFLKAHTLLATGRKELISTQLLTSRLRQGPPAWSTPPPRLQRPNNLSGKLLRLPLNREATDKTASLPKVPSFYTNRNSLSTWLVHF